MEADLQDISTPAGMLNHQFEHFRLLDRASRKGHSLPSFPLDNLFTPQGLLDHAEMHRALRNLYKIPAIRQFSDLDPQDKEELQDWMNDHYTEHTAIAAASF